MTTPAVVTLMTVDEVAESFRLTPATVRRLAANGGLRASKIAGQWRFDPEDVHAYVRGKQNRERRKKRRSKETYKALRSAQHPGRAS